MKLIFNIPDYELSEDLNNENISEVLTEIASKVFDKAEGWENITIKEFIEFTAKMYCTN